MPKRKLPKHIERKRVDYYSPTIGTKSFPTPELVVTGSNGLMLAFCQPKIFELGVSERSWNAEATGHIGLVRGEEDLRRLRDLLNVALGDA